MRCKCLLAEPCSVVAFSVSLSLVITECRSERSSKSAEPRVALLSPANVCKSERLRRGEAVALCNLLVPGIAAGSLPGERQVGEVEVTWHSEGWVQNNARMLPLSSVPVPHGVWFPDILCADLSILARFKGAQRRCRCLGAQIFFFKRPSWISARPRPQIFFLK